MHYEATASTKPEGQKHEQNDPDPLEKLAERLVLLGFVLALAVKFGKVVKLLKATTIVAKFAKVWVTVGTMAASIVVYAFTFGGWWLALGLVAMIFVHEMGHVWAMRREGM